MNKEVKLQELIKSEGLDILFQKNLKALSKELGISTTLIRKYIRLTYNTTYQSLKRDYFLHQYLDLKEKGKTEEEICKILKIKNKKELNRLLKYFEKFRTMKDRKTSSKIDKLRGLCCYSCGVYFQKANMVPSLCKSCYKAQVIKKFPLTKYEEVEN